MALGFCNEAVSFCEREAIVPNDFKNAMCYGQTGSGKTTGFILPAIKDRMSQNYGMVVFDFKGSLHTQIKSLALESESLEKIVEIGPLWGKKINIIKDISAPELSRLYRMMHGGSREPYWQTASNNVIMNLYGLLKTLYAMSELNGAFKDSLRIHGISQDVPSFKTLHHYLSDPKLLSQFVNSAERVLRVFFKELQKSMPERFFFLYEELERFLAGLQEYKSANDESSVSGKYGVLGVGASTLSGLAMQSMFNIDDFDWKRALEEGKVIIINCQGLDDLTLTCVSTIIGNHLASRIRKSTSPHPVSIVIDEAHRVLNEFNLPDTDICRESKYEYILATQDRILLYNKIGQSKTEELLRNIATVYAFKTTDVQDSYMEPTLELETFEYYDFREQKSYKAPKIHFSPAQLDKAQRSYLEILGVFKYVKDCKEEEILIHDNALASEYRVLIKSPQGDIRVSDYANPRLKRKLLRKKGKDENAKMNRAQDLVASLDGSSLSSSGFTIDERLKNAEKLLVKLNSQVESLTKKLF